MYNNPYNQYQTPNYNAYGQSYNMYQSQPIQQRPMQQQSSMTPPQDVPFSDVRFGTLDEAKAYIVPPMRSVMFINRNVGEFYIKTANNMGEPMLEVFKYSKVDNNPTPEVKSEFDPKDYVKSSDLADFLRKNDIKGFVTQEDLRLINAKLEQLQKQIKPTEVVKVESKPITRT